MFSGREQRVRGNTHFCTSLVELKHSQELNRGGLLYLTMIVAAKRVKTLSEIHNNHKRENLKDLVPTEGFFVLSSI